MPPIKTVPRGDCHDTCSHRSCLRVWLCSHCPAVKVWQLVLVSSPPQTVYPAWVWSSLPGCSRSGMVQLRPSGNITSADCWMSASLSSLTPPVTRRAEMIINYDNHVPFTILPGCSGMSLLQLLSTAPSAMYWIQFLTSETRA